MENSAGETPMIPSEIMRYSISLANKVDVNTTLKVLASPSHEASAIPGSEDHSDPVVRLVVVFFPQIIYS